jgi:hypothetical protein
MFRPRIAPRLTLGIAAAAISLTTLLSPSTQASADPLFKPDLVVKYKGETGVGGSHFYQFEVKNIGGADAFNASAFATVYRTADNWPLLDSAPVSFTVGTIPQNTTKIVTIPCANQGGGEYALMKCVGVKASIVAPGELDDSNNTASHGMTHT